MPHWANARSHHMLAEGGAHHFPRWSDKYKRGTTLCYNFPGMPNSATETIKMSTSVRVDALNLVLDLS